MVRAHHPRDAVFADQRRASPVADWMQIQDAGVHRHADLAQFVNGPGHFGNCSIDVGHRRGRECAEPIRM